MIFHNDENVKNVTSFLRNLRTAIQSDTTHVVVFSLDSQGEFLYSFSLEKQILINSTINLSFNGQLGITPPEA